MKKLLAGLMIGSLFSLGCGTDTTSKGTPPKDKAPSKPPMTRPGMDKAEPKDEGKTEPKKDEDKTEPKKDDSKKNAPKKDSN